MNGVPSFINKVLKVKSGDILSFGKIVNGTRSYIAVRGGFLGSKVLDSQSTCITSSILKKIEKGDRIEFAEYDGYFEQPDIQLRMLEIKILVY